MLFCDQCYFYKPLGLSLLTKNDVWGGNPSGGTTLVGIYFSFKLNDLMITSVLHLLRVWG